MSQWLSPQWHVWVSCLHGVLARKAVRILVLSIKQAKKVGQLGIGLSTVRNKLCLCSYMWWDSGLTCWGCLKSSFPVGFDGSCSLSTLRIFQWAGSWCCLFLGPWKACKWLESLEKNPYSSCPVISERHLCLCCDPTQTANVEGTRWKGCGSHFTSEAAWGSWCLLWSIQGAVSPGWPWDRLL